MQRPFFFCLFFFSRPKCLATEHLFIFFFSSPPHVTQHSTKTVRLYDVMRNTVRAKYNHKAAVLDCCFSDDNHAISGAIDRAVKMYEFSTRLSVLRGGRGSACFAHKLSEVPPVCVCV